MSDCYDVRIVLDLGRILGFPNTLPFVSRIAETLDLYCSNGFLLYEYRTFPEEQFHGIVLPRLLGGY